jgi:hypothetical protein
MTITLDVAKAHLRVDHTDDDADIERRIAHASAIVLDYIKKPSDWTAIDSVHGAIVEAATLMVLSKLYDDRNIGEEDSQVALGYLAPEVTAILHRLRDPALA